MNARPLGDVVVVVMVNLTGMEKRTEASVIGFSDVI